MKPYFNLKGLNSNKLLLKEEGHLISDERTSKFNELFFINITVELDLEKDTETFFSTTVTLNEVLGKFQYYPSINECEILFSAEIT